MRLEHDPNRNALRLTLAGELGEVYRRIDMPGVVDVAANGRLVGIELRAGVTDVDIAKMLDIWTRDPVGGEFVSVDPDGTVYVELTAGAAEDNTRSSDVMLEIEMNEHEEMLAVSIPRRGNGYEISYPSGNR